MPDSLLPPDRLRFLLESTDQGIYALDVEGRCTFLNRAASMMTGWSPEEALGKYMHALIHCSRPDGSPYPPEECPALSVLRTGKGVRGDGEFFRRRDGTLFPVEYSSFPMFENDRVVGAVNAFTDITERKLAEEALRRSQHELRLIMDAGPTLISYIDSDCRYRWANKVYESWFGRSTEEIRGRHVREVLGAAAWQVVRPYVERARGGETVAYQEELPLQGGAPRWLHTTYTPDRDESGRIRGFVVHGTDVSGLKAVEASLLQEKAFSESAINSMPGVFYLFREGGKLLRWNRNLEEVTGYSSQVVADMSPLDFFGPEEKPTIADAIGRVFREGKVSVEANLLTKSGQCVPHYFTGFRMLVDGVPYLIGAGIDITELRRAEDRLRQAQKLESLGVLAGGLAHDFNNLLVGVLGNASLARDMLPPDHPAAGLLDAVVKAGEQAAFLTKQMLAYSGQGRFLIESVDLSDMVASMSTLVQASMPKRIALRLDLEREVPPIGADRGQMQQVFMNLIHNAAEAVGSNAGMISVATGVRELDAASIGDRLEGADLHPGRHVYLEVSDTGCGMDHATRGKIFDPFFSTKFTGRGLGLAAVSGIVRSHKGAIQVSSAPGKGTCFTLLFPVSDRAAEVAPAGAVTASLHGAGTVLVVDDEAVVREMAKKALVRYGFDVLVADGGPAAIDVLKREPREISLVLLDLSMSGMGGEEILPELRKLRPEVKVIVSSGYPESETMRMFDGYRVSGFIQKPYTAARLAEKVRGIIG